MKRLDPDRKKALNWMLRFLKADLKNLGTRLFVFVKNKDSSDPEITYDRKKDRWIYEGAESYFLSYEPTRKGGRDVLSKNNLIYVQDQLRRFFQSQFLNNPGDRANIVLSGVKFVSKFNVENGKGVLSYEPDPATKISNRDLLTEHAKVFFAALLNGLPKNGFARCDHEYCGGYLFKSKEGEGHRYCSDSCRVAHTKLLERREQQEG